MQLKSRNLQIAYVLPRSIKLTAAEPRRLLTMLAFWLLMLGLVLLVFVAALSVAAWWDETQTTFLVSVPKVDSLAGGR